MTRLKANDKDTNQEVDCFPSFLLPDTAITVGDEQLTKGICHMTMSDVNCSDWVIEYSRLYAPSGGNCVVTNMAVVTEIQSIQIHQLYNDSFPKHKKNVSP